MDGSTHRELEAIWLCSEQYLYSHVYNVTKARPNRPDGGATSICHVKCESRMYSFIYATFTFHMANAWTQTNTGMAKTSRTFSDVRNVVLSVQKNTGAQDKVGLYDTWAENYEQDSALLDYRAPLLAAECVSSFFRGDREKATVLDVACGTGLVSAYLKKMGFHHFVGIDGSLKMLELAKKTGRYQQLTQCLLGQDEIPVEAETYDIVIIVGALSVGHLPLTVIRELWAATKPGNLYISRLHPKAEKESKQISNNDYMILSYIFSHWRQLRDSYATITESSNAH